MNDCCDKAGRPLHIAVIGSGAAAFAGALEAAERGAQVTMIERGTLGGTCVNVGCVPSKILIRAAELAHARHRHPFDALPRSAPSIDRPALAAQIAARVAELRHAKYGSLLEQTPNIRLVRGEARFADPHTLLVHGADGAQRIRADRFLIATGARPAVPPLPGLAGTPYWTSTEALAATRTPEHLLVIGGSVVAVELAQAFRRLGSRVTMLVRSRLLSREAPDLGRALAEAFADEGITVREGTVPDTVEHDGAEFVLRCGAAGLRGDALLVATGRQPNTETLDLAAAGVRCDERGAIVVDGQMRTSQPHIHAAGDCTTLPEYVYVAAAAGRRAVMAMYGEPAPLDLDSMPAVIFTDPQIATVGLDEDAARRRGIAATTRRLPMDQVPRALANFQTRGFLELTAETGSGRLLGARAAAPQAAEMIHVAAVAIRAGQTVGELAEGLFAYLTWAEAVRLCAQTFFKDVGRLSCCAG